jgi:hypothetical protein
MNNSRYLFATVALMFFIDARCVATAEQPLAPSQGARDQPAPATPESVLKDFLTALEKIDAPGIRRTAAPDPELSLLWQGQPLNVVEKGMLKAASGPSPFRRLKVGDQAPDVGERQILDATRINATHQEIKIGDCPALVRLIQIDSVWKVDASALIAVRSAVAVAHEREIAGARPNWTADAKLLDQLAPETVVDGLSFRPPAAFQPFQLQTPHPSSAWCSEQRKDGSWATFTVLVNPAGEDTNHSLGLFLDLTLEPHKKWHKDWNRSPVEFGRIDNFPCARARWSGTCTAAAKGLHGRRMRGVVYVVACGSKFVQIAMQDVVPEDDKSLPLCEASALTLQRVPDKH